MKSEQLIDGLNDVKDEYLAEAAPGRRREKRR